MGKTKKARVGKNKSSRSQEITDYDRDDTSSFVDAEKPLQFAEIGIQLPANPPTQVVSIRLPSELLNELRALGSQQDVPYQALIKIFLAEAVAQKVKKRAA